MSNLNSSPNNIFPNVYLFIDNLSREKRVKLYDHGLKAQSTRTQVKKTTFNHLFGF